VARAGSGDKRKSKAMVGGIAAAVAAVLLGAGAYYYFAVRKPAAAGTVAEATPETQAAPAAPSFTLGTGDEEAAPDEINEATTTDPAATMQTDALSAAAPPPTPDEIEAQVRALVAKGVGEMESSLKSEYEARLAELRQQLDDARKAAAQRETAKSRATDAAGQQGSGPVAETAIVAAAGGTPTTEVSAGLKAPAGDAAAQANRTTATPTQPARATGAAGGPTAGGTQTAANPPRTAAGDSGTTANRAASEPPPTPVKRGDLVELGPGVIPPKMVGRPRPVYPPAARKFAKRATIKMRLLVDENGQVDRVEEISPRARFGFDEAAEEAARATEWIPASADGVPVKMWVELTIDFQP
jgi:protein TonB